MAEGSLLEIGWKILCLEFGGFCLNAVVVLFGIMLGWCLEKFRKRNIYKHLRIYLGYAWRWTALYPRVPWHGKFFWDGRCALKIRKWVRRSVRSFSDSRWMVRSVATLLPFLGKWELPSWRRFFWRVESTTLVVFFNIRWSFVNYSHQGYLGHLSRVFYLDNKNVMSKRNSEPQ